MSWVHQSLNACFAFKVMVGVKKEKFSQLTYLTCSPLTREKIKAEAENLVMVVTACLGITFIMDRSAVPMQEVVFP